MTKSLPTSAQNWKRMGNCNAVGLFNAGPSHRNGAVYDQNDHSKLLFQRDDLQMWLWQARNGWGNHADAPNPA